jgi:hypothetical protein
LRVWQYLAISNVEVWVCRVAGWLRGAGRAFASSGDFKADRAILDRKEADGW